MMGFVGVLYAVLIYVGVSSSSLYWVWVALEGGLILVMTVGVKEGGQMASVLEYFLVQAFSSLLLMVGLMCSSPVMAVLGVVVKVGLMPFVPWVYRVVWGLGDVSGLWLVLGLQKAIPLAVVLQWSWVYEPVMGLVVGSLMLSMCMGSVAILMCAGVKWIIVSSSLFHSSWLVLMALSGYSLMVTYFVGYMMVLGSLMCMGFEKGGVEGVVGEVLALLASVPPMAGFGLKVYSFMGLVGGLKLVMVTMGLLSGVSLVGYMMMLLKGQLLKLQASVETKEAVVGSVSAYLCLWGLGLAAMCVGM
uniref:NADH dehydrogenase subunit 2 n=1 Tax=Longicollum sp. (in: thorny-headed worms) TaxID=3073164 RepID=A0AA49Q9U2_9BILA|nr:NADH dehydrogenase subunit 2 [Longicollum sp. (in: thorny-headed worms)]